MNICPETQGKKKSSEIRNMMAKMKLLYRVPKMMVRKSSQIQQKLKR